MTGVFAAELYSDPHRCLSSVGLQPPLPELACWSLEREEFPQDVGLDEAQARDGVVGGLCGIRLTVFGWMPCCLAIWPGVYSPSSASSTRRTSISASTASCPWPIDPSWAALFTASSAPDNVNSAWPHGPTYRGHDPNLYDYMRDHARRKQTECYPTASIWSASPRPNPQLG